MAVNLSKGANVSLEKEAPGVKKVLVGLGWDARKTSGADFDLDASCFMLAENGKVLSDAGFIFYNKLKSDDGSVIHAGDNLTGAGDGDDEQIHVDLTKVPANITRLAITVTIHDAEKRQQNFGQVNNAYVRIVNEDDNKEIARFDLSEDASVNTAMIFGELYRKDGDWKFKAVGQGYEGGLKALASDFGVNI